MASPLRLFFARRLIPTRARVLGIPRRNASTSPISTGPSASSASPSTIGERIRSRETWTYIFSQYRAILKLALLLNAGMLSLQLSVHGATHLLEESSRPTPTSFPWTTRYYIRRARIPNAWNPFTGDAFTDAEHLQYLEDALREVERLGLKGAVVAQLRRERAECLERLLRWEDAEVEYAAALREPMAAKDVRVECAHRLAKIREWRGDGEGALQALETGLEAAEGEEPVQLKAMSEMAVFLARRGDVGKALEMATEVLRRRREKQGELLKGEERRFTEKLGDPCRIAAAEAMVGELMFAAGRRPEGVRWTEDAFRKAWDLVDYRLACKECAGVAAANLVKMGAVMEKEALAEKEGWWGKGKRQQRIDEARRVKGEYELRQLEVEAVKAVRDAEVAKAR
jgi:tetratricopeptide (TPR) repeat protein